MELKRYQRTVLRDIEAFIDQCNEQKNIAKAFRRFWLSKGVEVAEGEVLRPYQSSIPGVPRVTVKVPTAGGKTFIACNALERIFTTLGVDRPKAVVWFVPSDPILQQTLRRLKDPRDPYRQRIDALFNGAVGVYSNDDLVNAKGFDPARVMEQLTIAVLSIDAYAARNKDSRRALSENSNMREFGKDNLMEVLASLNPVVIIDESHNFCSDLRMETLQKLNPMFILELTATPRESSNIISFVDAKQLKDEHMVKLPVIVYNQRDKTELIINAIQLRNNLERQANEAELRGGRYIRPIVLFQAQPKTADDSETFDKIKAELVRIGIPAEQIKIKTAERNELKGIDLMSRDCPVRYIITVNALKEGWDCPFAYILASLANRTSKIDVEQILGRILRLPYTKESECEFLNMAYVLTSSNNFEQTVRDIVSGLQSAGFTAKDYRAVEPEQKNLNPLYSSAEQHNLFNSTANDSGPDANEDDADRIDAEAAKKVLDKISTEDRHTETLSEMLRTASEQGKDFSKTMADEANTPPSTSNSTSLSRPSGSVIKPIFQEIAASISLPYFEIKIEIKQPNVLPFDGNTDGYAWLKLEKEHLYQGFQISQQDRIIQWNWAISDAVRIDLEQRSEDEFVPKSWLLNARQLDAFKTYISTLAPEAMISQLAQKIATSVKVPDCVNLSDLIKYIKDVIANLDAEKLSQLANNLGSTIKLFEDKIKKLLAAYAKAKFDELLNLDKIRVREAYDLPRVIYPKRFDTSSISKSLYTQEGYFENFEAKVIRQVVSLDNVVFWHRNLEKGKGFYLNGFINHYPDFIVRLQSGITALIETKGADRDNSDSALKVRLGNVWESESGKMYRYYMVFENNENIDGSITLPVLLDRLRQI